MGKVRKSRVFKPMVCKPGFESESIKVTNQSIVNNRAKERVMQEAESYHMGLFMNNLIERKYQAMNTTFNAGDTSQGFFSSRGEETRSKLVMNQTLRDLKTQQDDANDGYTKIEDQSVFSPNTT
jgi:hypothetical protein